MNATGYITVHAYTSFALLPLKDVAVTVTAADGTAIALRLTDRSGQIAPIEIPVPERSASLTPGYEQIEIENLQVFADTTTNQNLEMIPLSELPGKWNQTEIFDTPRQNL